MNPVANWYLDPGGAQGMRWWDGAGWTQHFFARPYEYTGPNHVLHGILTFFTFGLCGGWGWVWLVLVLMDEKKFKWIGPPPTWQPTFIAAPEGASSA